MKAEQEELKLCIACEYFMPDYPNSPRCKQSERINLVDGKKKYSQCWLQRNHECGKKGKYFKKKISPTTGIKDKK